MVNLVLISLENKAGVPLNCVLRIEIPLMISGVFSSRYIKVLQIKLSRHLLIQHSIIFLQLMGYDLFLTPLLIDLRSKKYHGYCITPLQYNLTTCSWTKYGSTFAAKASISTYRVILLKILLLKLWISSEIRYSSGETMFILPLR